MSALAEFARRQIRELRRVPGAPMPRPAQCQIVTRIAAHGVAAQAGVAQKDFLAVIDGAPAAHSDSRLYLTRAEQRAYSFYSRPRHELIELLCSGIEIGVLLEPTTNAVRATYKPANNDPTAQEILWAGRDFEALERLTAATMEAARRAIRRPCSSTAPRSSRPGEAGLASPRSVSTWRSTPGSGR
ncbi:MAG TPA: hypothetical protein VFM88_00095 [Vicinamibacteria bacterium]|nr:hypothetical protein [Vicinamibacteria bacterium]